MNQWTVETRNPELSQDAERALAVGLLAAKRLVRSGDGVGARKVLTAALAGAELLDAEA
jgi:hypothetical protein